jgi:hypothetical protein
MIIKVDFKFDEHIKSPKRDGFKKNPQLLPAGVQRRGWDFCGAVKFG